MQPRWLKVWREIRVNRGRTALVVLSIAIGVLAFGMMAMAQVMLKRELTNAYNGAVPAEAVLSVSDFSPDLLDAVRAVPGVSLAEARYELTGKIQVSASEWTTLRIQALPAVDTAALNQLYYAEGAREPSDSGVLLERSVRELISDVHVGGTINVEVTAASGVSAGDVLSVPLTVDGLVNDLSVAPSNFYPVVYAYIHPATLDSLGAPANTYNRVFLQVEGRPTDRRQIEAAVTDAVEALEAAGAVVTAISIPEPARHQLQSQMETSLFILSTMGVLALILSAIIIVNTMATVITQQIRDIGILKSMGGRTSQIFAIYLSMILIYGALALLVALPLGIVGAIGTSIGVSEPFNFNIASFAPPLEIMLVQAVAALVIPMIAASVPIYSGATRSIREAISEHNAPKVGRSWVDVLLRVVPNTSRMILLSIRNTFRAPSRLLLTLFTLSLAGSMFIAGEANRQALYGGIDALAKQRNYAVEFDLSQFYPSDALETLARDTAGVVEAETWGMVLAQPLNASGDLESSIVIFGVPTATTMAAPYIREGAWLNDSATDSIFINQNTLDQLSSEVRLGDQLTLQLGATTVEKDIVGISALDSLASGYISWADFERLTGITGMANRLVVTVTENTPEFQSAVEADLLDRLSEAGYGVTRSETLERNKVISREQIGTLVGLLFSIIIMVGIVGVISLGSTMSLNVIDRTREIGILRSLGATNVPIRRMVILESLTITALSFVPAALLSIPLGMFINETIGLNLFARPLDYQFPVAGLALWIVLMSVMAVVASVIPARNAVRLSIRETLAYQG